MKRWLLLSPIPIGVLLLAAGALVLQFAHQAEADIVSGDPLSCSASGGWGDALVVAPDSARTSPATTDTAALSAQCYFVGISLFLDGCSGANPWDLKEDLYVLRYLCYTPAKGWFYSNYAYCIACERDGDSVSDYRYWEVCTWYCEGEWVEWELFAVGDLCPYGSSDSKVRLSWLKHGMTWVDYLAKDHRVRLAPQWGTEVEYGPFWDRETEWLGGCSPVVGSGCSGYTTEGTCTGPIITDDATWDACGDVDEWFVEPEFHTYGYVWCNPRPGVKCTTYGIGLDIFWTE